MSLTWQYFSLGMFIAHGSYFRQISLRAFLAHTIFFCFGGTCQKILRGGDLNLPLFYDFLTIPLIKSHVFPNSRMGFFKA